MKATRILICLMAVAAMFFTSCGKDDGGNGGNGGGGDNEITTDVLAGTTWQYYNENDPDFHAAVTYTVEIGYNYDITFTRIVVFPEQKSVVTVMTGTYSYGEDKIIALLHYENDDTEYRITFTVSGDQMVWHYNLKDIILTKQ